MLNPDILSDTLDRLDVKPEIDLFASRLNHQFPRYVFYKPGPLCRSCECIHNVMVWYDILFFPSLLYNPSILNKIIKDRARGILVVPDWPRQPWHPILIKRLMQRPVLMSARENLLALPPNLEAKHRLWKALHLIIHEVSGIDLKVLFFLRQLAQSYVHPGVVSPADNMPHTSQSGRGMQTNRIFILFHSLWVMEYIFWACCSMLALAIVLFVWQDQLCRAILIVKMPHNLVNIRELDSL